MLASAPIKHLRYREIEEVRLATKFFPFELQYEIQVENLCAKLGLRQLLLFDPSLLSEETINVLRGQKIPSVRQISIKANMGTDPATDFMVFSDLATSPQDGYAHVVFYPGRLQKVASFQKLKTLFPD